jgi:hypothetical protein
MLEEVVVPAKFLLQQKLEKVQFSSFRTPNYLDGETEFAKKEK